VMPSLSEFESRTMGLPALAVAYEYVEPADTSIFWVRWVQTRTAWAMLRNIPGLPAS
jgi:hypothetical protein